MRALSLVSVLLSALLLFTVEPMIARLELPRFGGSAAVWTTCLLFFQLVLLLGYAWAHFGPRWLGHRGHTLAHLVLVVAAGAVALLPARAALGSPDPHAWPVAPLATSLAAAIGLPFLALSSNAALVQRWLLVRDGAAPWSLYAVSNAGSLVGLLAYPTIVEPRLGLAAQGRLFGVAYAGYALLTFALALSALRAREAPLPPVADRRWGQASRLRWTGRALVGSTLLGAVSFRIATDVAAVPLLWVLPLALYLVTFVLAFAPRVPFPRRALAIAAQLAIALGLGAAPLPGWVHLGVTIVVPLVALFAGAWVVHGDLARDRPEPARLTSYYLWIAVGGALGGLLVNLAAPLLFDQIAEWPLSLLLLAWAIAWRSRPSLRDPRLFIAAAAALALAGWAWSIRHGVAAPAGWTWLPCAVLAATLLVPRLPALFPLASAAATVLALSGVYARGATLASHRDFFGVLRVRELGGVRALVHGTTIHGQALLDERGRPQIVPTSYYHPHAPMGRLAGFVSDGARVAVVGLGTGSVAALLDDTQSLDYYELDPAVEPIARRWFPFLDGSRARVRVILGDARLTLAAAPPASYDLLLVDAFSSDAIPIHLLTVEAAAMYLDRLAGGGVLAFHVSNRHLDLERVMRGLARRLGVPARVNRFVPSPALREREVAASTVVALSRDPAALERLGEGWERLEDGPEVVWTDDAASLFAVLK